MKPIFFTKPAELRAWLAANHATKTELFAGFWKRATGKPSLTWSEAVDQALCFGWIDGRLTSLGKEAHTIRFTPRRTTSNWSAINVRKVATLTKAGKMRPAGLRAFAARKPERTAIYSFERSVPAALTPADEKRLRANKAAAAYFDARPPWYRRAALHWVVSAKREETRQRRLAQLILDSAAGRTIRSLTRPG